LKNFAWKIEICWEKSKLFNRIHDPHISNQNDIAGEISVLDP